MQFEFQDKVDAVNYCVGLASKLQFYDEQVTGEILRS
jgi:insulysin